MTCFGDTELMQQALQMDRSERIPKGPLADAVSMETL
jgi:hypothetical protein